MSIPARIVILAMLAASQQLAGAQVRVWEDTLTLPTYAEGQPNPNPPFDIFATTRFNYPYTLRENLTDHKTNHAWRAVYLENEYLKCSVLPDIGGHLYTCLDKISGQPMFYANPSIKKADIGYRGAWAAFGIEFNFPVSHNWASASPVDFAFSKHTDGSASITVGNIDRVYGMQWSVELLLRPNSTVLEERVTLNNRSDARHRFYWWNNAAVEVWDDSQICYPMQFAASHGFTEIQTWPRDSDGADLSVIRNQTKGPVSLFVHGSREPFMGVWHPKTKTGVVHYADYGDLPAKKIWSWGVDADGLDWRRALSDNNSAYVEVQAGLFRNQETYAFLEPRQTIHFSEYWMPLRDIGGVARANLVGVLNLQRQSGELVAGFNANQHIAGASVRISNGKRALLNDKVDMDPARTWSARVSMPDPQSKCTFELRGADGSLLMRQTEGEYDWTPEPEIHTGPQPAYHMPAIEKRTEDDWTQLGDGQELNGNLLQALQTYRQGLAKWPDSYGLMKAAGRLEAGLLLYNEALNHLEAVQRRDTSDPEIAYYLGGAYEGRGQIQKAIPAYEAAQRLPRFHSAATLRLAEAYARSGDLTSALRYLSESLRAAPDDLRTAEELAAVEHASGERAEAKTLAETWLLRFPTSYFLREQLDKPDLLHLAADPYRVLNIASEYMRLGLYERALAVLSRDYPAVSTDRAEPGSLLPQNHPLVAYFRGYCREKLHRSGKNDYAAASKMSTAYVFPDGAETIAVLQSALNANDHDATAHYLLGVFLLSRGLEDSALTEWRKADEVNPDIPVLQASIGLARLRVKHQPELALAAFQKGASSDSMNQQIYIGMDQALSVMASPAQQRVAALERYPNQAKMPAQLVYELALNRAEAGDYDGAIALFRNRFFPREEGGTNVRQVWIEVRLQQILALARSTQCDAARAEDRQLGSEIPGFSFTRDGLGPMLNSARTNFLLGVAESTCGQTQQAAERFRHAAEARDLHQLVWARAAAKKLEHFDEDKWRGLLEEALSQQQSRTQGGPPYSSALYTSGLLELALGRKESADATFREALLLPDQLLAYHLIRLARADSPSNTSGHRSRPFPKQSGDQRRSTEQP